MVRDCFVSPWSHCLTRSPHFALAFIAFMAFALLPPFFFGAAAASAAFFARFMPFAMLILQTLTGVQEDRRQLPVYGVFLSPNSVSENHNV